MSVSNWFESFCGNLRLSNDTVSNIQSRYKAITRRINIDYYGTYSETANSRYVGSYGRGTEIVTSDIDMLVKLPYSTYLKYNNYNGNEQSALLQEVRNVIQKTYSKTHLRGDGQVVVISFTDGIIFEIVPAFINDDGISYTYPDTNNGGAWKYKWDVPMNGLLIDTLAYSFMKNWSNRDKSYLYYDFMSRDFFAYLKNQDPSKEYWLAVGSGNRVYRKGRFEYKAKQCYNFSLEAIDKEKDYPYTAKSKWREIYGTKFPS